MENIILYCKSFSRDLKRVEILFESIVKHNRDAIPFTISVPKEDVVEFQTLIYQTLEKCGIHGHQTPYFDYAIISDQEITKDNLSQSWKNQQTIKMMAWKVWPIKNFENYLILDSDCYFIRDFYIKDFIHPSGNPYTIMHEQKDLFSWTSKNTSLLGFDPKQSFGECRTPIQSLFDRKGRLYDFGPVPVIWSSKVWQTLEKEYLIPNNLTYKDLIDTIPSEFSWYGETLLTWKPIELWPIEPMFKVLHYMQQYTEYKKLGYTEEHWSQNYLGVCMQSSSGLPLKY